MHPIPSHPDFDRFRALLTAEGGALADLEARYLARDGEHGLVYVPFHHVNAEARLVIVGITPGPTQVRLAYESASRGLRAGRADGEVLAEAKREAAFGGPMRRNLDRMLDHFGLPGLLGGRDAASLWEAGSTALECTSVVPHAAFRAGRMFAGGFDEVLASRAFRGCFERDFVGSLDRLREDALFVALGPTPLDALDWCVARGVLRADQVLGAFAHPSAGAGSQVDVYLGAKAMEDLAERDPVRHRVANLRRAAARMADAVAALRSASGGPIAPQPPRAVWQGDVETTPDDGPGVSADGTKCPVRRTARPPTIAPAGEAAIEGIHAFVSRGANAGMLLRPHMQDGHFIVSPTRFERDYIRVPATESLVPHLEAGLRLRMSAPSHAPSLISSASVRGWQT